MDKLTDISWLEWLPFRKWRVIGCVDAADEIPEKLPPRCAVVVGSTQYPKWIAFDCPCKTGHRIMLSLDRRNKPSWTAPESKPLTLKPSVDSHLKGKRCHYFISHGKVEWVHR